MGIFDLMEEQGHEQLSFCYYKTANLKGIIAIHNTALGNAVGGCRLWHYKTEEEAIEDALELSRIMTYQSAISETDFGGGKIVLWHEGEERPDEAYFRALGRFIEGYKGKIITYPDLGTESLDMKYINRETKSVILHRLSPTESEESSELTALGVFWCMKACAKFLFGASSLEGLTVAVQGVGSVGSRVVKHVMSENVKLIITDLNYDCLKRVQDQYQGVEIVSPDEILNLECDILSPCALGPIIGDHNIDKLKCKIIVGAAYNIFEKRRRHSQILYEKGILCAPDFVVNSAEMFLTEYALELLTKEEIEQALERIYEIMGRVLALSKKEDISPYEAALKLAEERIRRVGQMKGILC